MTRSLRLRKNDIERIYKKGRNVSLDLFLVRFLPNHTSHARFCVVISKKVLPLAVDRNHTKRQIYSLIQKSEVLWKNKSLDIALVLKRYKKEEINPNVIKILEQIS